MNNYAPPLNNNTGISSEKNNRLDHIDIAKSLGMLTIMWGHIMLSGLSNAFVYAFHIPLFFALSGMVFNKKRYSGIKHFVKKKVESLLIPYIIFSFITWVVWASFAFITKAPVDSYFMPLAQTFIAQGSGGFLVHNVPLWFVTCLFVVEIIFFYISDFKGSTILLISSAMAAVSCLLIYKCNAFDVTLLPWNLEVAFLTIPFYALGFVCVRYFSHRGLCDLICKNKPLSGFIATLLCCIVIAGSHYNGSISFGHADLEKSVIVAYACGIAGIAMFMIFCILLADSNSNKSGSRFFGWIKWFGQNSFNAMVIHNPIKGIVCIIVGIMMSVSSDDVSSNIVLSTMAFAITLIMTIIGIALINKIPFLSSKKKQIRVYQKASA